MRNWRAWSAFVVVASGLFAMAYGSWRGYVAARSALMPLLRDGDPTRTLIDAEPADPCARSRPPRAPARSLSPIGLADRRPLRACTSRPPAWRCAVTAATERSSARARALRGGHRHRDPLPAQDRRRRCSARAPPLRGRGAQHPRLPGLPRPPGGAAGDQPAGGGVRDRHRARDRGDDPGAHPVGAQELLLPGPAQGLPDQPVRDPAGGARAGSGSRRRTARSRCRSRARISRRTRPSSSTATPRRAGRADVARRLQPVRRAADGDRHRAGHPDGRAGTALRGGAPAAAARDRRERRGHGARPDAGRGERVAPAARDRRRSGRGSRSRT